MNALKQTYCRSFQTVFKMALPVLPYRSPKLYRSVKEIPVILSSNRKYHPLIITDESIFRLGLTKDLEQALTDQNMQYVLFSGTRPNPTTEMVAEAVKLYRMDMCDSIIAVGGGSPMDCAKAAGAQIAMPHKKLGDMAGLLKVHGEMPLLIAVPTTAGTGSETTLAAVIVDAETRHKYVINDFHLIPRYAVLDRRMIHSLPHDVAAATGVDALTHAVEAYIGRSTTAQTREDAERAVKLIFENLEKAADHTSPKAEAAMLKAAHYAGRAFTKSYVGYIHAVSHSLSGKYDLPHGQTNAILLPVVLKMYGEAVYKPLSKLALVVGLGTKADSEQILAKRFIQAVEDLNDRLGIPKKIPEIREEDIPMLARRADREANPLYPVPVLWDAEKLEEVYRKVSD